MKCPKALQAERRGHEMFLILYLLFLLIYSVFGLTGKMRLCDNPGGQSFKLSNTFVNHIENILMIIITVINLPFDELVIKLGINFL